MLAAVSKLWEGRRAMADGREHAETLLRYLGAEIGQALGDDDVTEIYVNAGDGAVWLDRRSCGRVRSAARLGESAVRSFLNAVASAHRQELTRGQPHLPAELPDGGIFRQARLQGVVPPLSEAPVFVLRKPATRVFRLDDYVAAGMLTAERRAAIGRAVAERQNILVAGGTRSGKTTLVNAVLAEVAERCPHDRVIVLEDTRELQCPAADRLCLRTTDALDLADLVKLTLRLSPDRIVIGEVRDRGALQLLDAWSTGHPGGVATVHATNAGGALERLDRLAQRNGVPSQAALVGEAVDLVVVIVGGSQPRRVRELVAVEGWDGAGYRLAPIGERSER
jgi:P-type conjugative transfer ATPase TrbB